MSDKRPHLQAKSAIALAEEHYETVFRFCSARVGYHLAGDATQETFLAAQRGLANFRGLSSAQTWLLGIAANQCRKVSVSQKQTVPLDFASQSSDSEADILRRNALSSAFAKLTDEHREIVILHEVIGLKYEDIARVLKVPVGTVKSRLHHAFLLLRKHLAASEGL